VGGKRRPDDGWRLDPRSVPHVLGTTEFAGERRCAWPGRLLDCVEVLEPRSATWAELVASSGGLAWIGRR
jgi:hypothetical protein